MITSIKLTVLFNEPFWIGVFEVYENDGYKVCKVTFGSEPKDEEIHQFILKEFKNLKFSSIIANLNEKLGIRRENPKRMQRKINKERKNEMEERKFQLKQTKKKEKHKGH